jgi:archaellum component FlaC
METQKLEQEHLEKINEFREQYAEFNTKIGAVATDEYIVSEQLKEIKKTKDEFFEELKTLKQNEEEFINELREKYGDGQINIQEGTFTSVPQPV